MNLRALLLAAGGTFCVSCGSDKSSGAKDLDGYWVWEQRVQNTQPQSGDVDKGQMKVAFSGSNGKCHYIWYETTGSDFHTPCTYSVSGDVISFSASSAQNDKAIGYSCAHPDWTSWSDRPATQYGRFKKEGSQLWIGVNTYWGFGGGVNNVPMNGSLKRFPFWESLEQAKNELSWIVFKKVSRDEWFGKYAKSTKCQGSAEQCARLPGCGPGEKPYID